MAASSKAHEFSEGSSGDYPTAYPHGDDLVDEEYAEFARGLWDEQEDVLQPLHDAWVQNLLFLSGRQWWTKAPISGEWMAPIVPEWTEQPVSNLSLAYFKTMLAKATKQRPEWQVVPASTDPRDIKAADLAEQVLEAKWMELRLSRQLRRAISWVIATGNAYLYPYWRTDTGKIKPLTTEIEIPATVPETGEEDPAGEPQVLQCPCDENGDPILDPATGMPDPNAKPHMVDEGDIGVRVYSPFQVRVSPSAECEEDVSWLILAEVMLLRDARERWPEMAGLLKGEEVGRLEDYDRMMSNVAGAGDMSVVSPGENRDQDLEKVLVLHYHERPCPEYPEGRYWICAGTDVLLERPTSLPEGLWPAMVHLTDIPMPGRYHGSPTLEAVVGLNREYNEINANIKEHHNLMTKGKWLVEKGTGIKKGHITNQPAEVIQVNTGFINGVKQADIKALPAPVYQERERVLADYEMVSGIHKISQGGAPSGVTSGVAFMQLQEADDTDLGPFIAGLEEGIAELAGMILRIIRDNYTDERLIHIVGPNKRYLAKHFRGADLEGAVDVIPVAGSGLGMSRVARQDMLIQLATNIPAMFTDPETGVFDTARLARLLPVGGMDSLSANEDLDIQEASREEEMFEGLGADSMEIPQVEFWQDHRVHAQTHRRVLKSAQFKEWSPEAQTAFVEHVQMHDAQMQQAMLAQMAASMPQDPNAPPGQGPPGSPPGAGPQEGQPPITPTESNLAPEPPAPAAPGMF